jgi:hypothetical protein
MEKPPSGPTRADRQAAALRANLKRRKAAKRAARPEQDAMASSSPAAGEQPEN